MSHSDDSQQGVSLEQPFKAQICYSRPSAAGSTRGLYQSPFLELSSCESIEAPILEILKIPASEYESTGDTSNPASQQSTEIPGSRPDAARCTRGPLNLPPEVSTGVPGRRPKPAGATRGQFNADPSQMPGLSRPTAAGSFRGPFNSDISKTTGGCKRRVVGSTRGSLNPAAWEIVDIPVSRFQAVGSARHPFSLPSFGIMNMPSPSLSGNQKHAMMNLNDRLATYLERVRSLEEANTRLELRIWEWYETKTSVTRDLSGYEKITADLRLQINATTIANQRLLVQVENTKLAADDFRAKYEAERSLSQAVMADTAQLYAVHNEVHTTTTTLMMDEESLRDELTHLKKDHAEDTAGLWGQTGHQVNVEMDSAPGVDLTNILDNMREQYEAMAEKNHRDVEALYTAKSESLKQVVNLGAEALQSQMKEITQLKRTLQDLEIEQHTLYNMKSALEGTLSEMDNRYANHIRSVQGSISRVEVELAQIQEDAVHQGRDYEVLLNLKSRLEMEITMYRQLLDSEENRMEKVILQRDPRPTAATDPNPPPRK